VDPCFEQGPHENDQGNPSEGGFVCRCTDEVFAAVCAIWSDQLYLSPLADKFWDLTLKILKQYLQWVERQLRSVLCTRQLQDRACRGKGEQGEVDWRQLVLLVADLATLDERVFSFARETIWPRFEGLHLEVTLFGRCLAAFSSLVASTREKVCERIG
jgi:hypothetical protein